MLGQGKNGQKHKRLLLIQAITHSNRKILCFLVLKLARATTGPSHNLRSSAQRPEVVQRSTYTITCNVYPSLCEKDHGSKLNNRNVQVNIVSSLLAPRPSENLHRNNGDKVGPMEQCQEVSNFLTLFGALRINWAHSHKYRRARAKRCQHPALMDQRLQTRGDQGTERVFVVFARHLAANEGRRLLRHLDNGLARGEPSVDDAESDAREKLAPFQSRRLAVSEHAGARSVHHVLQHTLDGSVGRAAHLNNRGCTLDSQCGRQLPQSIIHQGIAGWTISNQAKEIAETTA